MKVVDFINNYNAQKFVNLKSGADDKLNYIKKTLEVKTYIPFRAKREIAEAIVESHTKVVNGIKKYDTIDGYIGLIMATISAHTNLEFGDDPVADYDLIAESGLLPQILMVFKSSYDECDTILKMVLAMELEDNNINALVAGFLDFISSKLKDFDVSKFLDIDINKEDLTQLKGFLNTFNK